MTTYRKKPVEITAVRWTGFNLKEVFDFAKIPQPEGSLHAAIAYDVQKEFRNGDWVEVPDGPIVLRVLTPEGEMIASAGDYIIRGIRGELYPCKADIFEASYDKVG